MVLAKPGNTYTCEPLEGFPVKKDLVVNLAPATANMLQVQPWLVEGGKPIESRAEADASKKVRTCVECWACVTVCPVSAPVIIADSDEGTHALGMVKLARFALDPRDGANRAELGAQANLAAYAATCPTCRRCADVCPKDIDVYLDAVQVLEKIET
jgi:fumarate reductase (CoM/CoB) subunit B